MTARSPAVPRAASAEPTSRLLEDRSGGNGRGGSSKSRNGLAEVSRGPEVIGRAVEMVKHSGRTLAIAGVGVMLLSLAPVGAMTAASPDLPPLGDVPLYRANVTANGIQPGPGPEARPELAWHTNVGDMHMVPILVDGQLIVGTNNGHLVALDARTGATTWNTPVGGDVISGALASADGLVYASDTSA